MYAELVERKREAFAKGWPNECIKMANNTIFFPALFPWINARVYIDFKCNNKCANFKKTRIFEQSRSFIEGKWRERQENGEIV